MTCLPSSLSSTSSTTATSTASSASPANRARGKAPSASTPGTFADLLRSQASDAADGPSGTRHAKAGRARGGHAEAGDGKQPVEPKDKNRAAALEAEAEDANPAAALSWMPAPLAPTQHLTPAGQQERLAAADAAAPATTPGQLVADAKPGVEPTGAAEATGATGATGTTSSPSETNPAADDTAKGQPPAATSEGSAGKGTVAPRPDTGLQPASSQPAHPISNNEADALLAAAQAKVDAFASGLQLARQTAQKEARQGAQALTRAQGLARAGQAGHAGHAAASPARWAASAPAEAADPTAQLTALPSEMSRATGSAPSTVNADPSPWLASSSVTDASANPLTAEAPPDAAALARSALPQEVGSGAWSQALSQHLLKMVHSGVQNAQMQLNPSALGPLKITLSLGDQLQAQFEAVHPEVRGALEAALPQLRSALAAQGVALGSTSVGAGSPDASAFAALAGSSGAPSGAPQQFNTGSQGESSQGNRDSSNDSASSSARMSPTGPQAATQRPPAPGLLDTYA